jgi:heme-degrading monooxygenase HmoA
MRARSNSVQADPAMIDRLTAFARDDVMGMYRDMPGFVGISMLADRDSGRCIITTAWESEEAMRASDERADASRQEALAMIGGPDVQVETWDLAVMHRMHETPEGSCALVVWAHGEMAMEDAVDAWRAMVLPALEGMPGFCSVSVLVDRDSKRAVACNVYDSREALADNAGTGTAVRERFRAATGMTVDDIATFDVVLAHLRVPELA